MATVTNDNAAVVAGNGLGPRTIIATYSGGTLAAMVAALGTGVTVSDVFYDAFTIAGVDTANGAIALQGTGTLAAGANYGGATLVTVAEFA